MRRSLISVMGGFIFVAVTALNAGAQMYERMGGGMQGGMMMEGMGQGMGMMRGMPCGMMGGSHPMWERIMELNLDDKQKEALKALHSKTIKEMVKKRADKIIASVELRDLLDKEPVDMKAVEAAAKKNEAIETDMFLAHVRAHQEVKALLTPEQRKKFKEILEACPGPGGCGMMQQHRHHGAPPSDD